MSLEDAQVDAACQAWFEQWCKADNLYINEEKHYLECLPALHALSNRTTAKLNTLLEQFDDPEDPLRKEVGYTSARTMFSAAVAAIGWQGFAIRCATDPRGYAGYMQYIEQRGMYAYIDDLADHPHAGQKLKEALDIYGPDLSYPWIGAACIRWAMFGKNTKLEEVPEGVQWIKARYTALQGKNFWGTREVVGEPVNFAEYADVIKILLQSPELWAHMLLQEGEFAREQSTLRLWVHWAESVGNDCERERQLCDERKFLELSNCILQGDETELELMRLMEPRDYLLQKVQQHHIQERFELPAGVETSSPGL